MLKNISKYQLATGIAVFFHAIGLTGLLFFKQDFFIRSTPFNLLLSFALLLWTQPGKNRSFFIFLALVILGGFFAEVTGVNTGLLFGDYSYGQVLGPQWKKVPLLIGINWFIIIYCCGISTHSLLQHLTEKTAAEGRTIPIPIRAISVIADGATLAVAFDWLMEPVAVKLGFWKWEPDGTVPMYNYLCWLVVSTLLLIFFHFCGFPKKNKFAVNLLLIQALFFLILRTFLQ